MGSCEVNLLELAESEGGNAFPIDHHTAGGQDSFEEGLRNAFADVAHEDGDDGSPELRLRLWRAMVNCRL